MNHPPVITMFSGGMVTIPTWDMWSPLASMWLDLQPLCLPSGPTSSFFRGFFGRIISICLKHRLLFTDYLPTFSINQHQSASISINQHQSASIKHQSASIRKHTIDQSQSIAFFRGSRITGTLLVALPALRGLRWRSTSADWWKIPVSHGENPWDTENYIIHCGIIKWSPFHCTI